MERALQALHRASIEVYQTLYRLTLLHGITRNQPFASSIDRTALAAPVSTIASGLTYSIVISISGVFERDRRPASVRTILSVLTNRTEEACILNHCSSAPAGQNGRALIGRLSRLQRRLNKGDLEEVVKRLDHLRNEYLAHYALEPTATCRRAEMGDLDKALIFAANVVYTATMVVSKRQLLIREAYEDAQSQAKAFTDALTRSEYIF